MAGFTSNAMLGARKQAFLRRLAGTCAIGSFSTERRGLNPLFITPTATRKADISSRRSGKSMAAKRFSASKFTTSKPGRSFGRSRVSASRPRFSTIIQL